METQSHSTRAPYTVPCLFVSPKQYMWTPRCTTWYCQSSTIRGFYSGGTEFKLRPEIDCTNLHLLNRLKSSRNPQNLSSILINYVQGQISNNRLMTIDFLYPALILSPATLGAACSAAASPPLNWLVNGLVPSVYGLWNYKRFWASSWEILITRLCQVEAAKIGWKICCGLPYYVLLSLYISYLSFLFVNCQFVFVCEPAGSIPRAWFDGPLLFVLWFVFVSCTNLSASKCGSG